MFLTAGEPSGDRLGAALIDGLREVAGAVEPVGVGGPLMAERGLASLFPMEELSVMGIAEVLPRYLHLKRRIRETAKAAAAAAPDIVVTIDSPDFSFRVADALRRLSGVRLVHYVAPTVWAWRPGRARRLARRVDQVLALFPFEPPYFAAEGLRCDFVGHPIASEPPPTPAERRALLADMGEAGPRLVVLPGSRQSEIARLAPVFGAALNRIAARHPALRVMVPSVPHLAPLIREHVEDWPGQPCVLEDERRRRAALHIGDVALTKSGTVSLELAAARTPMVVAYDVNPATRWMLARLLRTDTVTLVNLISESRTVPEFLGRDCRPETIAPAVLGLIARPQSQTSALDLTMERLGRGGEPPGVRAARAVLDGISRG